MIEIDINKNENYITKIMALEKEKLKYEDMLLKEILQYTNLDLNISTCYDGVLIMSESANGLLASIALKLIGKYGKITEDNIENYSCY